MKIWDKVKGDPVFMRKANGWLTIFWVANFPPVIALYLMVNNETFQIFCLLYLALVSVWANVAGHLSAWQAGRVEVQQVTGSTLNDEDRQWLLENFERSNGAEAGRYLRRDQPSGESEGQGSVSSDGMGH